MESIIDEVRGALPRVEQYREAVKGDPDLELAVNRVDQVERFLEALAVVRAEGGEERREAAVAELQDVRASLKGPLL